MMYTSDSQPFYNGMLPKQELSIKFDILLFKAENRGMTVFGKSESSISFSLHVGVNGWRRFDLDQRDEKIFNNFDVGKNISDDIDAKHGKDSYDGKVADLQNPACDVSG